MKNERLFEIIRFIIVGGLNTVNYYIIYLLLLHVFHIQYLISHIIGFVVAFIISYYLNCYFVYKVKPTLKKFLAFPLTQVVNMGVQTLLIYLFVDFLDFNESIAPFVGLIVTIPITYVLSKFILTKRF